MVMCGQVLPLWLRALFIHAGVRDRRVSAQGPRQKIHPALSPIKGLRLVRLKQASENPNFCPGGWPLRFQPYEGCL